MSTILIVDDRADNRDVLTATLGHLNHRLLEAAGGEEALTIARRESPDLIISDVLMPKMDGYEFVQQLRRDSKLAHTTVVFYTANYIEDESRTLAKACGVNHVIVKPAEPEEILKTIDAALVEGGASISSPPIKDFARQHLHLVTDKLAQKVEELEQLNAKLEGEIEERTRIEAELRSTYEIIRASEQRFSSFMDNVPGFAWMKDVEGRYIYGNKFFQELLMTGLEWRGKTVEEVWPPEIATPLRENDTKVIETKVPVQAVEMVVQSGEKRAVLSSKFPILDGKGEVAFVCGIGIDITERKQAEERLREQADIINRAHDAIIIRNFEDRRIVFWNNGAERLYGWTAAEVMGAAGEEIFSNPKEIEKIMSGLLSTDEFRGEVKQTAKDGKVLITEGRANLVRNPDGTPRSILIICTDITEQKNLETRMLRAQRLESIGTLASGVAHDLNNILAPILMCSEMLKDNPTGDDVPALISMIEKSAKRGAHVVKQVFTFARGIEGERVVIKPSHLIQEMIDIAQQTFPKSIEIRSRYADDLLSIKCDPTQLHQVLLNLSVNARDAMPNGGSITISAENFDVDEQYASMTPDAKQGPHVMFGVTDTGAGMTRATIDKIFDPFFTTKQVGEGTGLGLSTVLGIVKSHGGFVSVDSEVGSGTTFKIFLPAQVSEESSQESVTPSELLYGNGEVVLVVDDEAGVVQMTKMILEKRSYRVLTAKDGPDALAVIAQQAEPTQVVLTDMSMPFMDSIVLIRAIKKMKPATLFIASTGQGEEKRRGELESLGVRNFLTKPYNTEKLLATVHETLEGGESLSSREKATSAI